MNFENIEKFLKKNYKKIIIVCLIIYILSNKMYENFSISSALDSVKAVETKVNDMFYEITKDRMKTKKSIYSAGEIKGPKITISNNGTIYADRLNLKLGIEKVGGDSKFDGNVESSKDIKGKRLCIGNTCIGEDELKVLTGDKYFSIQSARAGKNLNGSTSNAKFENNKNDSDNAHRIRSIRNK